MKAAPSLHTHGVVSGVSGVRLLKVLERKEALANRYPRENVLVWQDRLDGCAGTLGEAAGEGEGIRVAGLRDPDVVRPGDVIRLRQGGSLVSVLYRRGSKANSLFVTEQCNSLCLMCSQPPRSEDDRWRLRELNELVGLIDRDEAQLGITGGEPTLLRTDLGILLARARRELPHTQLHVHTTGRHFADRELARLLVGAGGAQTTWAIPLYGDTASVHDDIVASPGAFEETLAGLGELALLRARVEIRIVLHALSIPRLPQLASYIYRRMPFVEHVALMGLEPMGFAKTNRERLWIDPADYATVLSDAVHRLALRGMTVSIYNLPFCILPADLWRFAKASISDWKNRDIPECRACAVREGCAGFFASAGKEWRSRAVAPIRDARQIASRVGEG
jgi:His-Xaa-Ser system radical SAM maturase HxsC